MNPIRFSELDNKPHQAIFVKDAAVGIPADILEGAENVNMPGVRIAAMARSRPGHGFTRPYNLGLHLHVWIEAVVGAPIAPGYYCAVFKWPHACAPAIRGDVEGEISRRRELAEADRVGAEPVAMLVEDAQPVKHPKGMPVVFIWAFCMVRLQRLEFCPCVEGQSVTEALEKGIEIPPFSRDLELKPSAKVAAGIGVSDPPYQLIEGRPKIVERFPDADVNFKGHRLYVSELDDLLPGITAVFAGESAAVLPPERKSPFNVLKVTPILGDLGDDVSFGFPGAHPTK